MGNTLVLCDFLQDGWEYAKEHGIPRRDVVVPGNSWSVRGRRYDYLVNLRLMNLSPDEYGEIHPCFIHLPPDHETVKYLRSMTSRPVPK